MILMSKNSKEKIELFSANLPQVLVLVGKPGSGKQTLLLYLAEKNVEHKSDIYFIEPLDDKKQISIDQIRELKSFLKLASSNSRIIFIPNAEKLTPEAQNSLLKILEEPPAKTSFFLACPTKNSLLPTIQSRAVLWRFNAPSAIEIKEFYKSYDSVVLEKAILVSEGLPGKLNELIKNEQDGEFFSSLNYAKELLTDSDFDKIIKVNSLAKDPIFARLVIESLIVLCRAAIYNVSSQNNLKKIAPWQKRLNAAEQSLKELDRNVQIKLVLGKLFLMI